MADPAQAFYGMAFDSRPEVVAGCSVLRRAPSTFPQHRSCQDCGFAVIFLVCLYGLAAAAYQMSDDLTWEDIPQKQRNQIPGQSIAAALVASTLSACILSYSFMVFVKYCTRLVVWGSMLSTPVLMLCTAIVVPAVSPDPNGAAMISIGLMTTAGLSLFALCCCWRPYIPFTIDILREVSSIMGSASGILPVGVFGTFAAFIWQTVVSGVIFGIWYQTKYCSGPDCQVHTDDNNVLYFLTVVLLVWGVAVFSNVCHVTYCGIVGRWYFGAPPSVGKSFWVAITTSFGSICLGSLIVATIRAADAVLQKIRQQARENRDNAFIQIALCLLQCVLRCVEGIVEACSYFAYVQVAVRGFSFLDSARLTLAIYRFRNISAIIGTQIVGHIIGIGCLACGVVSGIVGCVVCLGVHPAGSTNDDLAFAGTVTLLLGMFLGFAVSGNILCALRSGFATLCICWAEDTSKMRVAIPNLDHSFQQRSRLMY